MKNLPNDLQQKISESDTEHLSGYIDMFDRLLLYTMAMNSTPSEVIDELLEKWEETIKYTINAEAQMRTDFMQSTPQGRLACKQDQPDGEALRLLYLNTLNAAKEIVSKNLHRGQSDADCDESPY